MKKVGIIGGSGYTGGELIRLVLHHPALELDFIYSTTRPGTPLHDTHVDLLGTEISNFTDQINPAVDVVFLCVGHGKSAEFLKENKFSEATIIIDLSNDFRLKNDASFQGYNFEYLTPYLKTHLIFFEKLLLLESLMKPILMKQLAKLTY